MPDLSITPVEISKKVRFPNGFLNGMAGLNREFGGVGLCILSQRHTSRLKFGARTPVTLRFRQRVDSNCMGFIGRRAAGGFQEK